MNPITRLHASHHIGHGGQQVLLRTLRATQEGVGAALPKKLKAAISGRLLRIVLLCEAV